MANYSIKQIAYDGQNNCLSAFPIPETVNGIYNDYQSSGRLIPVNVPGSQDATGDFSSFGRAPYQQIILNKYYYDANGNKLETSQEFSGDYVYYLKLTLPRNDNYDLNFALLAIPEFGDYNDLDQMEYQFIRYIHVPKSDTQGLGQSTIVLYEEPKLIDRNGNITTNPTNAVKYEYNDTDVKVAIAISKKDENGDDIPATASGVGKIFYEYDENNILKYYFIEKNSGEYRFVPAGKYYGAGNDFAPIGKTTSIMVHNWISRDTENTNTYEIIFKPRIHSSSSSLKYLYLYLIPESWDNDILWLDEQNDNYTQYYGRHINLDNVECELFAIKNLLGDTKPKRMGIWGRSELMFTINGEEIRIGPSGYYELQDFDIEYLGVVAKGHEDQFTIDIQYPV